MGDSWEDDDFEVPDIAPTFSLNTKKADDEEDLVETDFSAKPNQTSQSTINAAKKKAEEEERILAERMKQAELDKETPEARKLRLKKEVEQADHELTGELFGDVVKGANSIEKSSGTKGIGSIALKTKQDHSNFGVICGQKLGDSSGFNVAAYYKSLSDCLKSKNCSIEVLDEILTNITKIREDRAKIEKPAVKTTTAKKSKKELAHQTKKHADVFGGDDYDDKYSHLTNMEDDFM